MPSPAVGPLCLSCRHVRADYTCAAFPDEIPAIIVRGHPHETPVEGDNGIQYEPRPEGEPAPDFDDLEPDELEPEEG